jgi:hypothetical protein
MSRKGPLRPERIGDMRGRAGLAAPALLVALGVALVFVAAAAAAGSAPIFQQYQQFAVGSLPDSVAIADLDRDGRPDLVTANHEGNSVSVLLGNGGGTFQARQDYATGSGPVSVAAGDLNGDGNPDIVTVNETDVSVLLGNGDGTVQAANDYPTGSMPDAVAVGDLNGDGRPDIVTANLNGGSVSVLLGNGDGTFQVNHDYATAPYPGSVAVGDLNGDGRPDIVTANLYGDSVSALLGNGDGTFQANHDYATGSGPNAVAVGDMNGDGRADVVTANLYGGSVSVLLANTDGTLQAKHDYATGDRYSLSVAVGDLNADGRPDVVASHYGDAAAGLSVMLGNGDGTFQVPREFATDAHGVPPDSVAVGDLNGDGRPDVVTANGIYSPNSSVTVLLATTTPDTAPPSASPLPYTAGQLGLSGWYTSPVTVHWDWSDTRASSGMYSAQCPPTTTVSTDGVFNVKVTCKDVAGNTGSASKTVKLDQTAPTLAPTLAQSVYPFGGKLTLVGAPHASDAMSGVADASCGTVDTSTPGTWMLTCTATDNAGNVGTGSVPYIVARPLKPAGATTCSAPNGATAYFSGTGRSVSVPAGAVCVLVQGTHVTGPVVVNAGGTLSARGVTFDGNLSVGGSATVCGSSIGHSVSANGGSLTLGGPGCKGNKIANSVTVANETGNVWVRGNTIRAGGLTVTHATGATTSIVGNLVSGALLVAHSGPPVDVSKNHAKTASCVANAGQTGSGNVTHGTNTCPH